MGRRAPNTTTPGPPADSVALLLVGVGRLVTSLIDDALSERAVTLRHIGALGHLLHQPEMSYSALARRAGVTTQSMRETVARLEEIGAIERIPGGAGKPAQLRVTAGGQRLMTWARKQIAAIDADLEGLIGEPPYPSIATTLADLASALRLARQA